MHEEYLVAVDLASHVGTIPTWLASCFLAWCDLPLLFVYFQVNNGVLYFLDYEDIYIMVLSVLVSILNPNRVYYRRYFQHAHFIPIVGVGKRGEY